MNDYWKDRIVLVVGGSAGIGKAIARELAGQGAQVLLAARDSQRLSAATSELAAAGLTVRGIRADINNQEDVDRLFAEIQSRCGALHALVNSAGRSMRGRIESTTVEQHESLWRVNFLGLVRTTLAALPLLRQSHGTIVNIGSLASRIASPYLGAYPCSKFPVVAFSQQLRLELSPAVHVLLVLPGPIARSDTGERYEDQSQELPDSAGRPGGGARLRLIQPDDLARRIRRACERRQAELVLPARAKLLFALAPLAPAWVDRLIRRWTQ